MSARRTSARAEDGYVMIVVIVLVMVGLLVATAALTSAFASRTTTARDARVRRAQQAADAGIQTVLYQQSEADLGSSSYNLNGGPIGLTNFLDCTVPQLNASGQIVGIAHFYANSAGVCPQALSSGGTGTTLTTPLGQHTAFQAEMLTSQTNFLNGTTISGQNGSAMRELFPKIVSIGSETSNVPAGSGTVYSREEAILAPIAPLQTIEGEHNVSIVGLSALGLSTAVAINGDVLARNNLTLPALAAGVNLSGPIGGSGSGSSLVGTLAYGNNYSGGFALANLQHVSASQIIQRLPVTISPSKPDCSVTANCTALGSAYTSSTDTFSMSSGTVTFQPGDYVFCNFNATGGTINVSPTSSAPVRIFIDSPTSARCAGNGYTYNSSTNAWSGGNFNDVPGMNNSLTGSVNGLDPSGLQIYSVGDQSHPDATSVNIAPSPVCTLKLAGVCVTVSNPVTQSMVIYAPASNVVLNTGGCLVGVLGSCTLGGAGAFVGSLIGYDDTVTATAITQDLDLGNFPLYAGVNAFRVTQYVQCDTSVTSLTSATSDLNGC